MIRIRDLSVDYGSVPALCDINLDVAEGECVLITGPSGCGKSTLLRAITGLVPHIIPAQMRGVVEVDGLDTRQQSVAEMAHRVGFVFQNPASQLFHLLVEDDVAFGPRNLGLPEDEVQQRVGWALASIGAHELVGHNPATLSGGQKQLVAIAAALAMQPKIMVLDEPTASLDVGGTSRVIDTLLRLRRDLGMTILIAEHRLADVTRLVDRTVIMDGGSIVAQGNLEQLSSDKSSLKHLGLRRPVERALSPWESLLTADGTEKETRQPILALEGITAGYNHEAIIKDISIKLHAGEFVALVGENGAGKSTVGLVAAGLLKPAKGRIAFNGRSKPRAGLDVSLLFQDPTDQLFTDSVGEEVSFAPLNYHCFDLSTHQETMQMADLVALVERKPLALSAGQQQRTALASCLSLRPTLLILDEPTLGQDWGHLQRLMDFLSELNQHGATILLITHDYKLVHRYASRVLLIREGHIVLDGHIKSEVFAEEDEP